MIWRGVRPVRVHDPDLRRTAPIRNESNLLGIGRPLGPFVVGSLRGNLARRSADQRDRVDLLGLGVLRQVDGLDGECDRFAVGGKLRFLNPCELEQSLHIEGLLLGCEAGGEQQKNAAGAGKRHMTRLCHRVRGVQVSESLLPRAAFFGRDTGPREIDRAFMFAPWAGLRRCNFVGDP